MNMLDKMKIIVTGATGFIGREIVAELLSCDFEVYGFGNLKSSDQLPVEKFFKVDVTDSKALKKLENLEQIDAVVHSAGLAHQFGEISQEKFDKTNVQGTKNILKLAKALNTRHFVLISSTAIYGTEKKTQEELKVLDETAACRPQTLYAASKLQAEQAAIEICAENSIRLTIFRLSPVIGEGNAGNVERLVEAIDKNRFIWIGAGKNYKSLIYKKDVARACRRVLTLKKDGIEIFNLAAEPVLMSDFVSRAAKSLGKKIPKITVSPTLLNVIFKVNRKTLRIKKISKLSTTIEKWLSDDVYSARRFEQEYDFKPQTSVFKALEKQIDWYRKQKKTEENV